MWLRVSKVIYVALLGLMLFDGAAGATGCDGSKCAVAVCHACCCAPHVVPQGVIQIVLIPVSAEFIAHELVPHVSPPPKSLLRPPCLAA